MVKTGQEFDMNPKTFMLAGIFSMKLYRFTNEIMDIVSAAVKEMSIEKVRSANMFLSDVFIDHGIDSFICSVC